MIRNPPATYHALVESRKSFQNSTDKHVRYDSAYVYGYANVYDCANVYDSATPSVNDRA